MTTDRIKEIQKSTAYPDSVSVYQALLQVWNECEQEQSRQAAVSGSLPLPVKVLQVNGEFIKGELVSLQGPPQEGVTLKVHENCLVKVESVEPGCYQNTIIEINKKYISDWGGNDR